MTTITTLFINTFYDVAGAFTAFLVPILVIYILFDLLRGILWGRS